MAWTLTSAEDVGLIGMITGGAGFISSGRADEHSQCRSVRVIVVHIRPPGSAVVPITISLVAWSGKEWEWLLSAPLPRSYRNPSPWHDKGDSALSGCYRDNKVCLVSLGHVLSIPGYVDSVKANGEGCSERYEVVT